MADAFICNRYNSLPTWEEFDPAKHLMVVGFFPGVDIMGNSMGMTLQIQTPYAVWCEGGIVKRRNKPYVGEWRNGKMRYELRRQFS